MVSCFDSMTPLNQVARVGTSGGMQLIVEPFDKSNIKEIEKAIINSDLNLTPNSDGNVIRINLPPLTEDRRKDLVKQAGAVCEAGKVSIRNVRRDCMDKIKQAEKAKDIGKDESKGFQVRLFIILPYGHCGGHVFSVWTLSSRTFCRMTCKRARTVISRRWKRCLRPRKRTY